ncbi:g10913 [Coccomyxa viridis]|uniref:G10913 protein n=1 Tax=Coccomyxa viridis TaxID=1274662 RepID=A0ABP1GCG3_9CHLO
MDRRREERPSHAGGRLGITDDVPTLGSIHHAVVVNVRPFGLFVELPGFRRNGLVHNSQISEDVVFSREDEDDAKVAAMEYFAPKGSQVWVKVSEVRDDGGGPPKINCSMKAVNQEDGTDLDPDNTRGATRGRPGFQGPMTDAPPEVGQILEAMVATVKPFGIFVRLKGFRANGLVHLSQVSDHLDIGRDESDESKIASLSAIHAVGDPLFVKIVDVSEEPGQKMKVACSIKLADQREGADLDPTNTKYQPRGEGPAGGPGRGATAAAAVAKGDTVDWGHLRAGDQQYGDGQKQYDLLGDEVLNLPVPPPPPMSAAAVDGLPRPHAPQQAEIGSVEEALAILLKHKQSGKKKSHKEKKVKKAKEKDKSKKQSKKSKKEKRAAEASTDSD